MAQRFWDSAVIIDYLEGNDRAQPHVSEILLEAERGESRIFVSAFAEVEVIGANLLPAEAEEMIEEFFNRSYVNSIQLDSRIARMSREITRITQGRDDLPTIKPKDAIHVASAMRWDLPIFETYDQELIRALRGAQLELPRQILARTPTYEGQARLP